MFTRLDQTYYYNPNMIGNILQDVANPLHRVSKIIPDGAKVLDIGAGAGLLARLLHGQHKNLVIDGIEPNASAANLAKESQCYRKFYVGFAQDVMHEITNENYDYIVLADVIEHIEDPLAFLQTLVQGLSEKTKLLISMPNIAFGAIRIALLYGDFEYVDSGILEKTHLRFFTLQTLKQLVSKLTINMESLSLLQRNIFHTEINLHKYNVNPTFISQLLQDDLASTYQFLMVLTKGKVPGEIQYFKFLKE